MPRRRGMSWRWRAALAFLAMPAMLVGLAGVHRVPAAWAAGCHGTSERGAAGLAGGAVPRSWRRRAHVLAGARRPAWHLPAGGSSPGGDPRPCRFPHELPADPAPQRPALVVWVDASEYFGTTRGVPTTIDGLAAHLERHGTTVLGVRKSPTSPSRPLYPHASGFDVTFDHQHARIIAIDPDGSGILERVLQAAHAA